MAQNPTVTVALLPTPTTIVGSASDYDGRSRARDSAARTACRALLAGDTATAAMLLAQFKGIDPLV